MLGISTLVLADCGEAASPPKSKSISAVLSNNRNDFKLSSMLRRRLHFHASALPSLRSAGNHVYTSAIACALISQRGLSTLHHVSPLGLSVSCSLQNTPWEHVAPVRSFASKPKRSKKRKGGDKKDWVCSAALYCHCNNFTHSSSRLPTCLHMSTL